MARILRHLLLSALLVAAGVSSPASAATDRYALCGLGDRMFCSPLSQVAAPAGAEISYWWQWRGVAARIEARRQKAVTLISHSQGCKSAILLAWQLLEKSIRVAKLICFDGVPFMPDVPANVDRVDSWRKPLLPGGGAICRGVVDRRGICRELRGRTRITETTFAFGSVGHMGVPLKARAPALAIIRGKP